MKVESAMSAVAKVSMIGLGLAGMPAGAAAAPNLENTAWQSDEAMDCFVVGIELHAQGKAEIGVTTLDVLTGKWTLTGSTLNATLYLGENYPPLDFKAEVAGDSMQATYTWNEGTDGGPETETCELHRVKK